MNDTAPSAANPSAAVPAQPAWRRFASLAGSVVLGGVLLFAGWAKALDPDAFTRQVRDEGLEIVLPAAAIALFAIAIEFFFGTALLLGVRNRWVLLPTSALVAFFLFLTGRTYWRSLEGIEPPSGSCGCFGRLIERTPAEAFWQDLLLLLPPLILAWLAVAPGGKRRLVSAGIFTASLTFFAWKSPELPLDDYVTQLKPAASAHELCAGNAELGARTCLDVILPELATGTHLVIVADLSADAFTSRVSELNEFQWLEGVPALWVLSSATEEGPRRTSSTRGSR